MKTLLNSIKAAVTVFMSAINGNGQVVSITHNGIWYNVRHLKLYQAKMSEEEINEKLNEFFTSLEYHNYYDVKQNKKAIQKTINSILAK